ncbi:orotate phosphoribosyltransferase [Brachybacterium endophyticum]|uniref:Orotate phosphoribosyltransferase n=1 Tax=Brachybacterium endophyticum TaxID=2182385 RepID=A0A2U2RKW1_9MICO|nr:orotate phosphoribosyltransferase [Brachybacterium endophyticum]PWH06519.1 orotate phosphoribosyltransferase [Brachybacterium endophyticum]
MAENSTSDARARLLQLIDEIAVVRGKVTLSSGKEADYYVDLRRVTLHHEAAPLVGRVMLDLLSQEGLLAGADAVSAVGGLTLGADPVASAVLHTAAHDGAAAGAHPWADWAAEEGAVRPPQLDAFVVRKANKAHGLQRRIEGPDIAGRDVIAVEDTSTTGGSVLTACEAIEEAGARIRAVAVIMDRGTGAREKIEAAGYRYLHAYSVDELSV